MAEVNGQTDVVEETVDPPGFVVVGFQRQLSEHAHGNHLTVEVVAVDILQNGEPLGKGVARGEAPTR